ncbi:hypothetical protein EAO75_42820 [Streptomyces sp. uw30]|nr:hypothetical protein EAO75_42820 [Streptomyces sp. uw30]
MRGSPSRATCSRSRRAIGRRPRGTGPGDFPADLFAVGLVALYLLEGAKPDAKALVQYFSAHGTPGAPLAGAFSGLAGGSAGGSRARRARRARIWVRGQMCGSPQSRARRIRVGSQIWVSAQNPTA